MKYPFHPLAGQSVLIIGTTEHGGERQLIIRKPDGAKCLIPEWMTIAEAGAIRIMPHPRFSVDNLLQLRAFIDRLTSPSGQQASGGQHDEMDTSTRPDRLVEDAVAERANATTASESVDDAESSSQRSNVHRRSKKPKHRQSRGRR